jgi:flagellar secretion chaperone FliS
MWKDAYVESCVLSARPVDLVCLVYRHAIESVGDARRFLGSGDIAARSQAIGRAISAVSELEASLDHAAGGAVSRNLAELYHYIRQRLTEGNIRQAEAPLAEAQSLLATLGEAWNSMRESETAGPSEPVCAPPQANAWMEMGGGDAHTWSA